MHSTLLIVASLALLAVCVCSPTDQDVIEHIPPKAAPIPLATAKDGAESGASGKVAGAADHPRVRRAIGGEESDLLPSVNDVDASPFGETAQILGRGRIRVLPAFLG